MKQQGSKRKRHIGVTAAVAVGTAVLVMAVVVFLYGGLPGDLWYGGTGESVDSGASSVVYEESDSSTSATSDTSKAVDQQTLFKKNQQNPARSKLVKTAAAQIGNINGRKFWSWYGFESRVEWCACYVSWCADQCGYLDKGIIPKFAGVVEGAAWFADRAQWRGRGYQPLPGDIIFFDWQQDGTCDHVGIVEKCDGERVRTIEGNSWNMCRRKSYPVGSEVIYGYGVPKI